MNELIKTLIEIALIVLVFIGFRYEHKLIEFEDWIKARFKNDSKNNRNRV